MAEELEPETATAAGIDIGAYCRRVEDYLTRENGGHLVRIVGPGFELVRGWAAEGIPLSVVYRGIDRKLERHRAGHAARPLRVAPAAAALIGSRLEDAAMQRLDAAARAACQPIDDKRGTKEYRIKVAGVLARRAAQIALERARKS